MKGLTGMTPLSRRALLRGAAAVSGALAVRGLAAPELPHLRNGELLPDPDFSLLRKSQPYLIGVRPHRKGGVRLELDPAPLETPSGKKHLIHNYGHGGGGITLSWGCAAVATELVEQAMERVRLDRKNPAVAVLGTGVVGLTAATEIRRRWPALPVTVYARDLDVRSTTSFVAGGQFEPSGIFREYEGDDSRQRTFASYLRKARDRIVQIQRSGQRQLYGVAERKNYTLDHEVRAFDLATPPDVVPGFRKGKLPFEKLNAVGREYSNWLINPTILLPRLVQDLQGAGVRFVRRQFEDVREVAALAENVIVNCTGYGAKKLFADAAMVAQRGHLVVLQKTQEKQLYFFSGGCENPVIAYVFCRQEDIVVGGTVQAGNDLATAVPGDEPIFQRIIANARQLFGGHPAACVP